MNYPPNIHAGPHTGNSPFAPDSNGRCECGRKAQVDRMCSRCDEDQCEACAYELDDLYFCRACYVSEIRRQGEERYREELAA